MKIELGELKPGIGTDILVAEKVMGLKVVPDEVNWRRHAIGEAGPHGADVPQYSTNIEDAWAVIEKVGDVMVHRMSLADGTSWDVDFYSGGEIVGSAQARTAPMAICLAALNVRAT